MTTPAGNEFVRTSDPETSHDAVPERQRRESIQVALLQAYADAYPAGLTDEEAMEACGFDLVEDGYRRRAGDLRALGQIERNGNETRRTGRTGKARMVCYITHAGADRLGY
ncbi:hypothetical protein MYRNA_175 [Mycobacterium phage Myrna]|uniref:Uncharacterized protein n=1 Tax=Mycobacterium phage Myrna TaxID=546805 RepID=B5LJE7_9CAUD|nr:gp175 [Mycobacterium phage Myrna]ACH62144.1 hypothetical protein MYRNA_175 [Mycobacterium phage Myrna]